MQNPRHYPGPPDKLHLKEILFTITRCILMSLEHGFTHQEYLGTMGLLKFSMEPATGPLQNSAKNYCNPAVQCGNACL